MADLYILMFQEVSENGCLRLFMACGWYGALGRVANFEMRIDVPFTIPWKGCKFQKWGLRKWGYRICFFNILTCCTCCRMIIKGGGGVGGCINVLDEHFLYVTEDAHVAHAVVWSSGGFPALAFSLQMEPQVLQPVVTKIIPTKGSRWPKWTTKKISLLRLIIF